MSDCGHACCDERSDPHHDHFLPAGRCCVIPPGTPPPKVSAEVWGRSSETQYDVLEIADVVRVNDTWHVVVVVDD